MQAIVSDQSGDFGLVTIGTDFTVIAAVNLPPGNWVAFATATLTTTATGTTNIQTGFLLGGEIYSPFVQTQLVVTDLLTSAGASQVVPITTGLTINTLQTLQVACRASPPDVVYSQPSTITAIQVESLTRIQNQWPGELLLLEPRHHDHDLTTGRLDVGTVTLRFRSCPSPRTTSPPSTTG